MRCGTCRRVCVLVGNSLFFIHQVLLEGCNFSCSIFLFNVHNVLLATWHWHVERTLMEVARCPILIYSW